jgi:hypothetical protein
LVTGFLKRKLKFRVRHGFWQIKLLNWCTWNIVSRIVACKFQGFVISDWEGIDRITYPPHKNYSYSILKSVNAGVDMVCY